MGLSTFLYFQTFKNLSILLAIMTILYSIFALVTNIIASQVLTSAGIQTTSLSYITISLSSKETNKTDTNSMYYFISCWLGVGMLLIWMLVLIGIKFYEVKDSNEYDQDTVSCSDYTILLDGMPTNANKDDLQRQLNAYFETSIQKNSRLNELWKKPLNIAKINVGKPFYLTEEELRDD
jgi:hypothetical protein